MACGVGFKGVGGACIGQHTQELLDLLVKCENKVCGVWVELERVGGACNSGD